MKLLKKIHISVKLIQFEPKKQYNYISIFCGNRI